MSRNALLASTLIAVAAVAVACAPKSSPVGAGDVSPSTSRSLSRNRDLITQEELTADPALRALSVIEVIRSIRPQYLVNRGTNVMKDTSAKANSDIDAGKVHASVDGGRVIEVTDLTMSANDVLEIRYLNVAQANLKFGVGARQGPVILVTMKKQ